MSAAQMILVRHAATAANLLRPPVLQGRRFDNELDELGHRQAEAVGLALADYPLACVYSSPMKRARQTAEAIARPHGLSVETIEQICEVDVGIWEGHSWEQIAARWPDQHRAFIDDSAANGYLEGESFSQVCQRCLAPLEELASRHPQATFVVVGHNTVNRALLAHWLGIPLRYARRIPQDNAAFNIVRFEGGKAKAQTINSASHLSGLLPAD